MEARQQSVVLFYSMSGALRAEKLLKTKGVVTKLIPVPRHLGSDCGVCLRFGQPDEALVRMTLEEAGVEIQGIHPLLADTAN